MAALEDTRSFAGQDGIQYLGYDGVAARKLHQRILDGDAAAHETYKDPVKAAEALLNLQGGSGEMTELLYEAGRQYLFFQKDSTRPGEGSVANVHYIFADGSGIDIPMVFAEESSQIWMLSLGDIDSKGRHSTGPLDGENQARVVYAEYGPRDEDWATVAELSKKWVYVKVSPGSFADVAATYQVSSYGIYAATGDDAGLNCMVPGYIAPGCAAEGRSTVYQNVGNYYTSDSYRQEMAYLKQQDSVRLYYLAASDYQDGDLEIWIDTIREYDTSGQTGENGVTDWKLPSEAQDFSADMLTAEGRLLDPESEQRNRPDETSASVQPAGLEWEGGGRSDDRGSGCLCNSTETGYYDECGSRIRSVRASGAGDLCPVGSGRRRNRREASVAFENGTGSKRSGSFAAGSIYICGEYHARRDADGTESGKQHLRLHS